MRAVKNEATERKLEKAMKETRQERYVLSLYVTGTTSRSTAAIDNVRRICKEYLKGSYEIEIIDIYQQPQLIHEKQIIDTPSLIERLPIPLRRIISDMSDKGKLLVGINLKPKIVIRRSREPVLS